MAKLPNNKFAHALVPGPVDPTMKDAAATSAKLYRVPVGKIKVIPGFNVRVLSADYLAHKDSIQRKIAENGYDSTKPLAGYVAKEDGGNVIYVTDGHTRLQAVLDHNSDPDTDEKDEIATLPVLVQPKEVSLTDLTVMLHTANDGRPLTPYELGVVSQRLLAEDGNTKAAIARRLDITARYLDDVLLLAGADAKVKKSVADGKVSSTMAIWLLKADPDTAAEKIEAAVKATAGTGKKATKKHTKPKTQTVRKTLGFKAGDDMKELVKQAAAHIRDAIKAEEDGEDKLSTVDGAITLVIELPAEAAAPKKAATPKEKPVAKAKAAAPKKAAKPKPKVKTKPAAKSKPVKPVAAEDDGLGIEGAELLAEDDDEPARLPPKVESDDVDDPDDI